MTKAETYTRSIVTMSATLTCLLGDSNNPDLDENSVNTRFKSKPLVKRFNIVN